MSYPGRQRLNATLLTMHTSLSLNIGRHGQAGNRPALGPSHLLPVIDELQRGHLAVPVGPEHLAHGAGGSFAAQAVDVDLLVLMLSAHDLLLRLGSDQPERRRGGDG